MQACTEAELKFVLQKFCNTFQGGGGDELSDDHGVTKSGQLELSDDYFESYPDAFQPSETPRHLQHRYMVSFVANGNSV